MLINKNTMLITYFIILCLTFLHGSTGVQNPSVCFPEYIVYPQYNQGSGSMFSNSPAVLIFTNTVIETVYKSDFLRFLYDLSDSTALQYTEFSYRYNLEKLNNYGYENAESLAGLVFRVIPQNFDVIRMPFFVRFKANLLANLLHVAGILSIDNAEGLALQYIETVKRFARVALTPDPESKFYLLSDSFFDFYSSVDPNAEAKLPFIVWMYENEWFVGAVNYKHFNNY